MVGEHPRGSMKADYSRAGVHNIPISDVKPPKQLVTPNTATVQPTLEVIKYDESRRPTPFRSSPRSVKRMKGSRPNMSDQAPKKSCGTIGVKAVASWRW